MTASRLFPWALLLTASVPAGDAWADAPKKTSSLGWTRLEGAEGCIGTHDLAAGVEGILGRSVFVAPAQADLSIEGHAEKKPGQGFKAVIVVAKASGETLGKRELDTDQSDCRKLDGSLELAIALLIDPNASLSPTGPTNPPPDPNKPPEVKTIIVEKKVFVPVPVQTKPTKPKVIFEGYAGGAIGAGQIPFGGGGILGIVFEPLHFIPIEATAVFLSGERTVQVGSSLSQVITTGEERFYYFEGSSYLCPLAGRAGILDGALCAGAQAGLLKPSVPLDDDADESIAPMVNLAARGRVGLWVYPFIVSLGATFSVPLLHQHYPAAYRGAVTSGSGFETAPVAGTFDLSIGFKFPKALP